VNRLQQLFVLTQELYNTTEKWLRTGCNKSNLLRMSPLMGFTALIS